MGIKVRFTQALWVEQYIEPAASAVTLVVGDFDILEVRGVDILLHGPEVEKHGSLQVIEEHAVSFVQMVVPLRGDDECGPVGILQESFLG